MSRITMFTLFYIALILVFGGHFGLYLTAALAIIEASMALLRGLRDRTILGANAAKA